MAGSPHFEGRASRLSCSRMKTIHISEMIAEGGRDGKVEAPDGRFAVELSTDEQADSITPEHLFGSAYAACFLGSLKSHAEKAHIKLDEGATVTSRVHLEEDDRGGY